MDEGYTKVNRLSQHIVRGKYDLGTADNPGLVSGVGIENAVGAIPDSKIPQPLVVYLPNRKASSFNNLDAMHSFNTVSYTHLTLPTNREV